MTKRRIARLTAIVWLLLATHAARADRPAEQAQAKQHFEEATAAFNLGEFMRAAEEYKQAYKLSHDPVILYNIAQAYRLGNDFQQAIFFYRSYLRSQPSARNRGEVEDRIAKLEQQQQAQKSMLSPPNEVVVPPKSGVKVHSTSPPEPMASTTPRPIAPVEPPRAPPPVVSPPVVSAPVAPAPDEPVKTAPPPEPSRVDLTPRNADVVYTPPTPIYKKWWLWTIVGVAVVGIGVGVGVGLAMTSGSPTPSSNFGNQRIF